MLPGGEKVTRGLRFKMVPKEVKWAANRGKMMYD